MPSRMEKYYQTDGEIQKRSRKNEELYKTIYDDVEYTNVEGISIIEKNERIDIEKIRSLLNVDTPKPERSRITPIVEDKIETFDEEKSYDIKDVLSKAKSERPETNRLANTQYNILKNINLDEKITEKKSLDENDLKNMIEAITTTSKLSQTSDFTDDLSGDLLDDLKTLHDSNLKKQIEVENKPDEMDKSFFTSFADFKTEDFEELKDIKNEVKKNNTLVKIILFIFAVIIVTGIMFIVYHFMGGN